MDKRVYPVDPGQQVWTLKKEVLDRQLPEHPQFLFDVHQLQRMFPCKVDRFVLQRQCCECSCELICLISMPLAFVYPMVCRHATHPVYQSPIPTLDEEWKPPKHTTQQAVLEYRCIWCCNFEPEGQDAKLSCMPVVFTPVQQRRGPRPRRKQVIWTGGIDST